MTAPLCPHCTDVLLVRDRYPDGTPKNQKMPSHHIGMMEIQEMWSCPRCLTTRNINVTERPMTPAELVRWAKWLNKQVEVA